MQNLVENLTAEWEGEAQTAFKTSFEGRKAQFQQFEKDVESFALLMDTAAKEMRQTEEALRSRMSQGV
jgi:WXG100 family type VII secretion target